MNVDKISKVEDILLRRPFSISDVSFKPGGFGKVFAHADPRAYFNRLNEVFGSNWNNSVEIIDAGDRFVATNSINIYHEVFRSDVGEAMKFFKGDKTNENAASTAQAQAFKRSCVSIGIGEYLYHLDISKGQEQEKIRTPEQRFWDAMEEQNRDLEKVATQLTEGITMSDIFNE